MGKPFEKCHVFDPLRQVCFYCGRRRMDEVDSGPTDCFHAPVYREWLKCGNWIKELIVRK